MSKDISLQPIGKRVLVLPDKVEEKTSGGLYVPASANEDKKSESGIVVKLGTVKKKDFSFSVALGDRVFFEAYAPKKIDVEGTEYLLINEDDILAISK